MGRREERRKERNQLCHCEGTGVVVVIKMSLALMKILSCKKKEKSMNTQILKMWNNYFAKIKYRK